MPEVIKKIFFFFFAEPKRTRGISTSAPPPPKANKTLLWGATGEQEWTPALTTGE